uniref:Uncharacterized protein n=1 Tax=Nelumbo nucifera TaxID=4432 RepID=A0A822ZTN5_NELNU|nr:TPA_asm: hypothetical protein HUJ06_018539 [Nelumbo nucifera]
MNMLLGCTIIHPIHTFNTNPGMITKISLGEASQRCCVATKLVQALIPCM